MTKKAKLGMCAIVIALSLNRNLFAQFNLIPAAPTYGRTLNNGTIVGIGIGNFTSTNLPLSALHINTNLLNAAANFLPGEVFRTDCPMNNAPFWRMFRGGIERARFYNPLTNENLVIETAQPNGNILFNTQSQTGSITQMTIIHDGQVQINSLACENCFVMTTQDGTLKIYNANDLFSQLATMQEQIASLQQQVNAFAQAK